MEIKMGANNVYTKINLRLRKQITRETDSHLSLRASVAVIICQKWNCIDWDHFLTQQSAVNYDFKSSLIWDKLCLNEVLKKASSRRFSLLNWCKIKRNSSAMHLQTKYVSIYC